LCIVNGSKSTAARKVSSRPPKSPGSFNLAKGHRSGRATSQRRRKAPSLCLPGRRNNETRWDPMSSGAPREPALSRSNRNRFAANHGQARKVGHFSKKMLKELIESAASMSYEQSGGRISSSAPRATSNGRRPRCNCAANNRPTLERLRKS
jgi:hypothetical protein